MQRLSSRAALLGLALTGGMLAALFVVFVLSLGGSNTPSARAIVNTPTPTTGPAPTPKPNGLGNLSGVFDVAIGPGLFQCIMRTDHDSVANEIKGAAYCYNLFPAELGAPEPPCAAWHGPGPQGANTPAPIVPGEGNCAGHTGPPPYSIFSPTKVIGAYCPPGPDCAAIPGTGGPTVPGDTLYVVGCFADIGSILGPNLIRITQIPGAKAQLADGDPLVMTGTSHLFFGQTNAQCAAAETGVAPGPLVGGGTALTFTKAPPPRDFDGDGCTDADELFQHKPGSTTKCGDDPFNPYDPTTGSPLDVSGPYDLTARAIRADISAGTPVPGLYYGCKADIQQSGKNLTARILCYIDYPGITVNPQVANCAVNPGGTWTSAGVYSCPPADPKYCGDGQPGAAPPGCALAAASCAALAAQGAGCPSTPCDVSQYQWADIDNRHTVWTGTLDNTSNTMNLSGCFKSTPPEGDGFGPLGNFVIKVKINAHTGIGIGFVAAFQTDADCLGPDGIYGTTDDGASVTAGAPIDISAVRQAPGPKSAGKRDSDGDGCSDKKELGDAPGKGGLRDPLNRWDYFDPTHDAIVRADDLLKVVQQYNKNQGNAAYTIDTDRSGLIGGNGWNLGPPDGLQGVIDMLAAVKQYGHDCI